MPSASEATICALLHERLATLTLSPTVPISWPEVPFTPPPDGSAYLDVAFIPNLMNRDFVGSTAPHRAEGLYQISVVYPRGVGTIAPLNIAGLIAAHFPADLSLISTDPALKVRISQRPTVAAPMTEDADVRVPVTVSWRCFI